MPRRSDRGPIAFLHAGEEIVDEGDGGGEDSCPLPIRGARELKQIRAMMLYPAFAGPLGR